MDIAQTSLPSLTFNVAGLLKGSTGGARYYDVETPAAELNQLDDGFTTTAPFVGAVRLLKTADTILAQVRGATRLELECARCLDPFESDIAIAIEEEYHPSVDIVTGRPILDTGDDAALIIDEKHILDLSEVMRQAVLLALPLTGLCRPDCAGLCPTCGVNRNFESCACATADFDLRWSALRRIRPARDFETISP